MSAFQKAADVIHGPRLIGDETDYFTLVDLLRNIAYVLLFGQGCRPKPDDLHKFMTRRYGPLMRLAGFERRRDDQIREMVAEHWKGDPLKLPYYQGRVLSAARRGEFSKHLIAEAFAELSPKADAEWDA